MLLCAALLSACSNEGAQKENHLTDRNGNICCVYTLSLEGFDNIWEGVRFSDFSVSRFFIFAAARMMLTEQIENI